jgi:para-aminobenzoate synthetase/4-amino-4-deoxychorismate lyase
MESSDRPLERGSGDRRLTVIARDARSGKWRLFERPLEVVTANRVEDVLPAMAKIEAECTRNTRYAAGFLSYEASPAFDRALTTRPPDHFPLLWFGIYSEVHDRSLEDFDRSLEDFDAAASAAAGEVWTPSVSAARYADVFDRLQELIRNGDTYQVNFTYRLRTRLQANPFALFLQLAAAQRPPFGAYVDTGDWMLCSASPELFFHREGSTIESRPMKGTAARGLWFEQDLEHARRLRESEKERAENVMIVDMVRNDLGRIAHPGTVRVTNLFDVERYPTVLQLTSTVTGETSVSLTDAMAALFPAASITGAPKARTMEIIAELECSPRRIYTGSIGFIEPGGRAQFNVAIRTVLVEAATREAEYGVGGGIVADSVCGEEWEESRVKARVLAALPPSFDLLETMLWRPDAGYVLLARHLKRLLQSADYFGFQIDLLDVRDQLDRFAPGLARAPQRIRMLVSRSGSVSLSAHPVDIDEGFPSVALAAFPIDSGNPFLYHKTTNRQIYEEAVGARPGFSDVLLYNERNLATESTIANLVVEMGGELLTPPVESGLLPGTLRAHLLEAKQIRERSITVDEVLHADARYLLNSVRGFHAVSIVTKP